MHLRKELIDSTPFQIMKLVTLWFGSFLLDDRGNPAEARLFPAIPEEIAHRLVIINEGGVLNEERDLWRKSIEVCDRRLTALGTTRLAPMPDRLPSPSDFGYDEKLLHEALRMVGQIQVKRALSSDEIELISCVDALDDLHRSINLLRGRLEAWSSLPTQSDGRERLLETLNELMRTREMVEKEVRSLAVMCAPNLSRLLGPVVAARLISKAGGLETLSRMPASTIQILGAERAFFRHIAEGAKMPKHGYIYQHPWVHRAPRRMRGRIARSLAAKAAIAARCDRYGGNVADDLITAMERRIQELRR